MALSEAEELLSFVEIDHAPGRVQLHLLGNQREWVLIVRNIHYFIWSVEDWLHYRQREEDGARARAIPETRQTNVRTFVL